MDFLLLEPNPYCCERLRDLADKHGRNVEVLPIALGVSDGRMKFYGLTAAEGGTLSQGGSIMRHHNSALYEADEGAAIEVDVRGAAKFLAEHSIGYDMVIMKMDIEGAELDVLENILDNEHAKRLDTLYVEFHAKYQKSELRPSALQREYTIVSRLRANGVNVRIWH